MSDHEGVFPNPISSNEIDICPILSYNDFHIIYCDSEAGGSPVKNQDSIADVILQ